MVGCTYRAKRNKWQVQIRMRKPDREKFGNFKFLGYYQTKQEAEDVYDQFILDNELHLQGYPTNRNLAIPPPLE
jgi:hypothetical protein